MDAIETWAWKLVQPTAGTHTFLSVPLFFGPAKGGYYLSDSFKTGEGLGWAEGICLKANHNIRI